MDVEVRIPALGESVSEAVVSRWLKHDGEHVAADEPILEIETEKASMEIQAEAAGRLSIVEPEGSRVQVGAVVARIATEATAEATPPAPQRDEPAPAAAAPGSEPSARTPEPTTVRPMTSAPSRRTAPVLPSTAPARTGSAAAAATAPAPPPSTAPAPRPAPPRPLRVAEPRAHEDDVERVRMTELRRTIAARLVEAQHTAAILTTFNEVDLSALLALRKRYRERFREKHQVDLGLMSLFARATIGALRDVPIVNARIDGDDIVYHRRVHLGIAVATPRGLVVPIVRDADTRSLAELEREIGELAARARDGKLAPDDLAGGTFTITNGGVFGSLLSTPLLNPPQSGILGMHKIQERPIAVDGQVAIRPMMYVALSYDHRLVDGEQAVRFLVRVKEQVEDPGRMLLEV